MPDRCQAVPPGSSAAITGTVQASISGDSGILVWPAGATRKQLTSRIIKVADQQFQSGVRRLEVEVAEQDAVSRQAVQIAGFRLEGRKRDALLNPDGSYQQLLVYSRLNSDAAYDALGRSSVLDTVMATKRVIAHVLYRNSDNELLLLETSYKQNWELPGGIVEPDETPRAGAMREIREELGFDAPVGYPAIIDWMPRYLGWSDALEFIFDGGQLDIPSTGFAIPNREIISWHWVDPGHVSSYLSETSARRIATLLANPGKLTYTEYGLAI